MWPMPATLAASRKSARSAAMTATSPAGGLSMSDASAVSTRAKPGTRHGLRAVTARRQPSGRSAGRRILIRSRNTKLHNPTLRLCTICGVTKPVGSFYQKPRNRCKECHIAAIKACRARNIEKIRAYDRDRSALPHRVAGRLAYSVTENGRARSRSARAAWDKRNPEKHPAHTKINNALQRGKIIRPSRCSHCGGAGRLHGHHPDYSLPLAVEWLCAPCHRAEHKKSRNAQAVIPNEN